MKGDDQLIFPYIEEDPKAFFTPDRSRQACVTVLAIAKLRAESVDRQLSGQLATRSEDQNEEDKVDASGISIKDMGTLEDLGIGNTRTQSIGSLESEASFSH